MGAAGAGVLGRVGVDTVGDVAGGLGRMRRGREREGRGRRLGAGATGGGIVTGSLATISFELVPGEWPEVDWRFATGIVSGWEEQLLSIPHVDEAFVDGTLVVHCVEHLFAAGVWHVELDAVWIDCTAVSVSCCIDWVHCDGCASRSSRKSGHATHAAAHA